VPLKAETKQEVTIPKVVPDDEKSVAAHAEADKGPAADTIVAAAPQVPSAVPQQAAADTPQQAVATPVVKTQPEPGVKQVPQATALMTPVAPAASESATADSAPVFKVQLLATDRKLPAKSSQLKGVKDVDCYREGGLWKYTTGASTDYNEIYQLRKSLLKSFPQAFIIAFRQGEKMDVNEAIREFKKNKK
jgi:N-acetylmuramoyl-L-alanine amidase